VKIRYQLQERHEKLVHSDFRYLKRSCAAVAKKNVVDEILTAILLKCRPTGAMIRAFPAQHRRRRVVPAAAVKMIRSK